MNAKEINFAYKVRHALNENLESLPAATADRLASARMAAVSRKKRGSALRVFMAQRAFAGNTGALQDNPGWLGRLGAALPMVILAAGLFGIYQVEDQNRISNTAEIDTAVLSDELPISAYLDRGFNAFLAQRGE